MTQEKALEEFKKLFPDNAPRLAVQRNHTIGFKYGYTDEFMLWDHSDSHCITDGLLTSSRSWEHVLAIAKSDNEDCWEEDNSPVDTPSEVKEVA